MSEPEQIPLLKLDEWWEEHWKGMPEYVSQDLTPFKTVYVHFDKREDMQAFAALVGQTITLDTKSIWYPRAEIGRIADKRYIDALPDPDDES